MNTFLYAFGIWWLLSELICFADFFYQIIRKTKEGQQLHSSFWKHAFDILIWAPFYAVFMVSAWVFDALDWIRVKLTQMIARNKRRTNDE